MKYYLIIAALSLMSINLYSQKEEKIEHVIELPLYEISDSINKEILNTIVVKNIPKADYYSDYSLYVYMGKDLEYENLFLIQIKLYPMDVIQKSSIYGIVYVDDIPFIVNKYCQSSNWLKKTNSMKTLKYNVYPKRNLVPEEFYSWNFFYSSYHKELKYTDLYEALIRRLGFIFCDD